MKMSRLAFRLLQWLLPSLLIFGLISTSLMAWMQYRQEMQKMDQTVELIQTSFKSGIELNLWNLEQASLKKQLEGILEFPDMARVEILPLKGDSVIQGQEIPASGRMTEVPLEFKDLESKVHALGVLRLYQSYDGMWARVVETIVSLAASELLKIFLLGLIALTIVQRLITRHLKVIGQYAAQFDVERLDIELHLNKEVRQGKEDEIDQIADAFEQMRARIQSDINARRKAELALKEMNENLESLVEERTRELSQAFETLKSKNHEIEQNRRKIADLLNNMTQAVFKVDNQFQIVDPVSQYSTIVFGRDIVGHSVMDILFPAKAAETDSGKALLSCLYSIMGEDEFGWDLNEDALPRRIQCDSGQILNVNYSPIWSEAGLLDELMLTVEDITEVERIASENRKNEELVQRILSIMRLTVDELKDFFRDIQERLERIRILKTQWQQSGGEDLGISIFRELHTIKGNSRIYKMDSLSLATHEAENEWEKLRRGLEDCSWVQFESFMQQIHIEVDSYKKTVMEVYKVDLDTDVSTMGHMIVPSGNYQRVLSILQDLSAKIEHPELDDLQRWIHHLHEPTLLETFQRYEVMVTEIAQKIDKNVEYILEGAHFHVGAAQTHAVHDAAIHLIRNALDHGLESRAQRQQLAKPEKAQIRVQFEQNKHLWSVIIRDDGKGMDPEFIRAKAIEKSVISPDRARSLSPKECLDLIFLPGFSSRDDVSDLSGRGIGMDVVYQSVTKHGGHIEMLSTLGIGTEIRLNFPQSKE
jgi:hypothetical protein